MAPRAEPRASPPGQGAGGARSPVDAGGGMSAGDFLLYCLGRLRQVHPAGLDCKPAGFVGFAIAPSGPYRPPRCPP
jgi:hypothetical protein